MWRGEMICASTSTGLTGAQRKRGAIAALCRAKRPPCAFRDAAQGNDLRRRFDRLDRRATKAERDCGAWPRRATALCVPRCRSGKGLRRRSNRLGRRAMNAATRLRRLAAPSDRPVRSAMPLRKMTCAGAPTGLTGAQRKRGTIAALSRAERLPCAFRDAAQGKACAGASTGLTGAQRMRQRDCGA